MILTEGINFINHFYESMISKSEKLNEIETLTSRASRSSTSRSAPSINLSTKM